jgi:two-component system capsular synthesis response regulator RcsB
MLIRVFICDDHPLVSTALKSVLKDDPAFLVMGEPASGPELIAGLRQEACELVILDYSMPGELDGIGLIQYLTRVFPSTHLLIFSGTASAALAARCLEAGAHGFMQKTQRAELIKQAVRIVANGGIYIDPSVREQVNQANLLGDSLLSLSPREMVVVRMLLAGLSVSEISAKLNRSIKTVSTQKQSAYRKLNIQGDSELFRLAGDMNIGLQTGTPGSS